MFPLTALFLIVCCQEQLDQLPPPLQRAVAPLSVLQAAVHEVPQLTREGRQRGAHPFQQERPPVRFCHRGAAKLPHVSGLKAPCTLCLARVKHLLHFQPDLGGDLLLLMTFDTSSAIKDDL